MRRPSMLESAPRKTPRAAPRDARRPPAVATWYIRLTLAFVVGLYLPWAATAPDLLRHFGEAVHSWAILFFAPVAAWRLVAGTLPPPGEPPAADPAH